MPFGMPKGKAPMASKKAPPAPPAETDQGGNRKMAKDQIDNLEAGTQPGMKKGM
jgi:hypothetical protein